LSLSIVMFVVVLDALFQWAWVSEIQNGVSIVIYQTLEEVSLLLWIIIGFEIRLPLPLLSMFVF